MLQILLILVIPCTKEVMSRYREIPESISRKFVGNNTEAASTYVSISHLVSPNPSLDNQTFYIHNIIFLFYHVVYTDSLKKDFVQPNREK